MLSVLADPLFWTFVLGGTFVGYVVGAIPGFNAGNVMVLLLPLTLVMEPLHILIFFGAIYGSSEAGGSWPAIIINVPGTPSAAAAALDGYPLCQQGRGDQTLGLSAISSALGSIVGATFMLLLTQLIGEFALAFGPREMFALVILALAFMISLGGGWVLGSAISGALGLAVATVGVGPMTGTPRGTLGLFALYDGVPLMPLLLGMFGLTEAILLLNRSGGIVEHPPADFGKIHRTLEGMTSIVKHSPIVAFTSVLGAVIGFIPGLGATIASWVGYSQSKRLFDRNQTFGKGDPAGVVAAETPNNAAVGGALIPVFALGIPGSPATAILMSALLLQGVTPGPAFLAANEDVVGILALSIMVTAPMIVLLALLLSGLFARVALLPGHLLVPIIVLACLLGAFSERQNIFDMVLVVAFGLLGLLFERFGLSRPLFVLAFILGPSLERFMLQSLSIGSDSIGYFFDSSLAQAVYTITLLTLMGPVIGRGVRRVRSSASTTGI